MTVQDDDQLLVCRNSTPYNLKSQNVMAELLDDDLMLVCRAGTPYKATGLEIKESIGPQEAPPSLTSVVLTEDSPGGSRFDNQSFTSTLNWATKGVPEASLEMKATVTGTLDIAGASDEIVGIQGSTSSFTPVIYTGNGGTQSITTGFAPDLVWVKNRTGSPNDHVLFDILRGPGERIYSNNANAQGYEATSLTSFNADGFTLGGHSSTNAAGVDSVSWSWSAGDTTVTNNEGSIESQVRSNGAFSIIKYSGTGSGAFETIGHGLNAAPSFVLCKRTDNSGDWWAGHVGAGWTKGAYLQVADAFTAGAGWWNNTDPDDSVITLGSYPLSGDPSDYIAYCWAESATQSFGSYTGNNTSNPITCGFEPAFVLIKNSSEGGEQWHIYDNARSTSNPRNKVLFPNLSNAEDTASLYDINFTSSGFELLTSNAGINASGRTYIYAAFGAGSPNTTLTLASDASLANGVFKAGDEVKQDDSPLTPTSSAITNVAEGGTARLFTSSTAPANLADALTKTEITYQSQVTIGTNEYLIIVPNYNATGPAFTTNGTGNFSYYQLNDSETGHFASDGTPLGGYGSYNDAEWVLQNYTTDPSVDLASTAYMIPSYTGGYTVFQILAGAGTNGVISGSTTLTLTNSDGLDEFEVGDVVQNSFYTNGLNITGATSGTSTIAAFIPAYNAGSSVGTALGLTEIGDYVEFRVPAAGTLVLEGGRTSSINAEITATGDFTGGPQSFEMGIGNTAETFQFTAAGVVRYTATNASNGIYFIATTSLFNGATFTVGSEVSTKVTAISPSTPSITTDGGTWNTGEVVTGPTTDITATFVSADPSVPSMTVSDVVGTWSANTGNYVVNTVVNPILIKPETSAITNVGTTNVASGVDVLQGLGNVIDNNPVFTTAIDKGDSTTAWGTLGDVTFTQTAGAGGTIGFWYSDDLVTWVRDSSTNWGGPQSVTGPADKRYQAFNSGGLTSTVPDNTVTGTTTFSNSSLNFVAVKSLTLLTLTDDTDLAQFATGDNVYAAGVAPATFAAVTYAGDPAGAGVGPVDVGFAPDLVWIKRRNGAAVSHNLMNSLLPDKKLESDTTDAQADAGAFAFTSNGFQPSNSYEQSYGDNYVAWCWSAGDTTVTNNEGSVEAQVRSNGNFSIAKWASVAGTSTFGHGLNSAPKFVITKNTGDAAWYCYHEAIGFSNYLTLNSPAGTAMGSWGQAPTDTLFSYGSPFTSGATNDVIAYCWSESATQSFGSYTGNGLSQPNAPVIDCGFEPAFVLIKKTNGTQAWYIYDNVRSTSNPRNKILFPDLSDIEEENSSYDIDFTSTGFTPGDNNSSTNANGSTYIYAAFAAGGGPSGVVGDITGLDMTLSESSGTWEAGQKVTMDEKPAISTTANLIFDSTGAVTGVSTQPVAGQLVSNKDTPKLTFGDGAGTGETWDEELPAGTHLQTSFVATNVEGTSSATSNEITP